MEIFGQKYIIQRSSVTIVKWHSVRFRHIRFGHRSVLELLRRDSIEVAI
jgi:hypothetical protein